MSRIQLNQNNFTTGEVSPRLYSRVDNEKYKNGLETATNCIVLSHGPVQRRNGFQYVASTKNNSDTCRLLRFQFSETDSYIIEMGDQYARFFTTNGAILLGGSPYEITTPYTSDQLSYINYVQFGNKIYLTHPDVSPRILTRNGDTAWTLEEAVFFPPPTYEPGYKPTSIDITLGATTGLGVTATASAATFLPGDVGRQIVTDNNTGRATITDYTSTTVVTVDILDDFTSTTISSGTYTLDLSPIVDLKPNGSAVGSIIELTAYYPLGSRGAEATITGITKANPGVVTTSAAHGVTAGETVEINDVVGMTELNGELFRASAVTSTTVTLQSENTTNYVTYSSGGTLAKVLTDDKIDAFRSTDVGKYILINGGVVEITQYISGKKVEGQVLKSLNSTDRSGNWSLEEETWTANRGYPSAVGIYQDRLVYASTAEQPQTIWLSETSLFDAFGVGPNDDDSIEITLSSSQVNDVSWLAVGRDLVVGSSGSELTIGPASSAAVTPSNIQQTPRTYHGSAAQRPIVIGNEIIFIQNNARKIRNFRYDFEIDGYTGEDLTFLSEHITSGGVKEIAYAQDPDKLICTVLNSGDMVVGTYDRLQKIIGWSLWTTDGNFESVESISNGTRDEIWVVVNRTINGSTVRYIERLGSGEGVDRLDPFVDSYLTYSNPIVITGATKTNPVTITTATSHGFTSGQEIKIVDVLGMTELNNKTYKVLNPTTNTFQLTDVDDSQIDGTSYTAYISGGEAHDTVTNISGLSHLEGKEVVLRVDGATHPNKTVSGGAITTDNAAYEAVIGLPYTTTLKTLRAEFNISGGSVQGQKARRVRPILRVYRSSLPTINGSILPSRNSVNNMDEAVPLYSGDLFYNSVDWDDGSRLTISSEEPLPLMVTGIHGTIEGNVK